MNGTQYEEFCRLFLVDKLGISIQKIKDVRIPSSTRPGLQNYSNQIDLYWEDENELAQYVNIADAKWRGSSKVDKPDVLLIQQVKQEIAANKAMMITNSDFTKDARAAAENHGIALHIVRPNFDYVILHQKNRETIQTQLQESFSGSKPAYIHQIVHRAFDFETGSTAQTSAPGKTVSYSKGIKQTPMNRMASTPSHRRAPTGKGSSVQKGSGTARGGGGRSNRGG